MCLAQGHNTVEPVRLEPAAPWSRVKHSTTEPLCCLILCVIEHNLYPYCSLLHLSKHYDMTDICYLGRKILAETIITAF